MGFKNDIFTLGEIIDVDGLQLIRQRLERATANKSWWLNFPRAGITYLPAISFYHSPISLKLRKSTKNKPTVFRFEQAWTPCPACKSIIKLHGRHKLKAQNNINLLKELKRPKGH